MIEKVAKWSLLFLYIFIVVFISLTLVDSTRQKARMLEQCMQDELKEYECYMMLNGR